MTTNFYKVSERVMKGFHKGSERVLKGFHKGSEKVSERVSEKVFGNLPSNLFFSL